ncbi:MAG: hypothetical protein NXH74_03835 [Rhodobacteraceae bacterium]|nr:hypothetical protein [Paracoccaceae bacterium]
MKPILCLAALAALTACAPSLPESGTPDTGAGVGFGDHQNYIESQRARDAALAGNLLPSAGVISDEPAVTGDNGSADLAAEATARLNETRANSGDAVLDASPANPTPQTVTTATGISDENDFDAVGDARTIDDDAALIARNRAQYQVVQPTALPSRGGSSDPNIVAYALSTQHPVGTRLHSRVGINKEAKAQRACANYASPDQAQIAFLEKGGPQRDRLGLDPDGDGYACGWDPESFRAAVRG